MGWIVNGPLGRHDGTDMTRHPTVKYHRISIAKIAQLLFSQYNQGFSERAAEEAGDDL